MRLLKTHLGLCLLLLRCCHVESLISSSRAKLKRNNFPSFMAVRLPNSQRHTLLQSAPMEVSDVEDDRPSYSVAQKSSMRTKYRMLSIAYACIFATLIVIPDRTLTKKLASKLGGAGGFGVAAGISWMLSSANDNERLHSQTSRQLNVGLLGFSSLGLLAVPGEAAFTTTAGAAMVLAAAMNAARMLGIIAAYTGWSMGVGASSEQFAEEKVRLLAPRKAAGELWTGAKATIKSLKVTKESKKRSLTYRNCALLVTMSMLSCLMEGIFYMRYYGSKLGTSLFDISLQWSGVARLFLISTVIFSLKDLADRDRMLMGTTFIKLNLIVGAWASLVAWGQSLTPAGYSTKRIEMLAFSLPFFIKGLKAAKFKSDAKGKPLLQPPPSDQ